jgi:mannose-6-phosphate isomerase-like protein (cupin superfamily)
MMKRYCGLTVLALLVTCASGFAQGVDPAFDNTEPATPTFLIEQPETRIVLVDMLADATRSMHSHAGMLWHVFVTMNSPVILTIEGQTDPVTLGPWQSYFFTGGTTHAITNPGVEPIQFLEFFSKKLETAANVEDGRNLALAFARALPGR